MKLCKPWKKYGYALLTFSLAMGLVMGVLAEDTSIITEQKMDYYEQYRQIVDEVSKLTDKQIYLLPKHELKTSDWVTPEEFKQTALEMANLEIKEIEVNNNKLFTFKTKQNAIMINGISDTLSIYGDFETQYYKTRRRQLFNGIKEISTYLSSDSVGIWQQIGWGKSLMDGGRTYKITIWGTYKRLGIYTPLDITVMFYCHSTGAVS